MAANEDNEDPLPEGAEPYSRAQKALLAAVVAVGLLIMAGVGVVVFTIVNRLGKLPDTPKVASSATVPLSMPAESRIELPSGATVEETVLDGSRLAIRYRTQSGTSIVLFDLTTGQTLGTVALGP